MKIRSCKNCARNVHMVKSRMDGTTYVLCRKDGVGRGEMVISTIGLECWQEREE